MKTDDLREKTNEFKNRVSGHIEEVNRKVSVNISFEKNVLVMKQTVRVTFHRIDLFK
jgi:hypothetical protein